MYSSLALPIVLFPPHLSFPRKRESIALAGTEWIPAFAGMTLFAYLQAKSYDQEQLRKI
jgi:hypothetical protein